MQYDINIGCACKIIDQDKDINIKSIILRRLNKDNLRAVIEYNLSALFRQLCYLDTNDIRLYRICSDFIPFGSHRSMPIDWKKEYRAQLADIGKFAKEKNIRLSMHPGQYTVLNSPNPDVLARAIDDLAYHCDVLDALELDCRSKIILHIGGVYGDKEASSKRFIIEYHKLSSNIKKRLVLENDHKNYDASDVLDITGTLGCPFVFDYHHEQCLQCGLPLSDILSNAELTWKKFDGRTKIHYSQQHKEKTLGAHSETIDKDDFLDFIEYLKGRSVDLMLEVKDKNISALKCKNWLENI